MNLKTKCTPIPVNSSLSRSRPYQLFTGKRLWVVLIFVLCTALWLPAEEVVHFENPLSPEVLTQSLIEIMSNAELLGQTLMFGYPGETADKNLLQWIQNYHIGGIKIFGPNARNLKTMAQAVGTYQKAALMGKWGIPLLVATDQEGGIVRHIKGESSVTPGNMSLAAGQIPMDAWKTGYIIGQELAAVGVNMNFAPTIDIFVNPKANVLETRSFSSNPVETGILGTAFSQGLHEAGIISTAKHFPGHGDTEFDSHGTLPVIRASLETLEKRELIPYKMMIAGGVPVIMAGHLAFPSVTGDKIPATRSKKLIDGLLRKKLGFNGVIITDDLHMLGANIEGKSISEISYQSILAGIDILLISRTLQDQKNVYTYLLEKMTADSDFRNTVKEAAQRIVLMKTRWLRGKKALPYIPDAENLSIPAPDASEFFLNQAARGTTLIQGERFPLLPQKAGRVLLTGNAYGSFFTEGRKRYKKAGIQRLKNYNSSEKMQKEGRRLLRIFSKYDSIILLISNQKESALLRELKPAAEKIFIISVNSPVPLKSVNWIHTSLSAYGTDPSSFRAAFAALAGDFTPEGILPIPREMIQ